MKAKLHELLILTMMEASCWFNAAAALSQDGRLDRLLSQFELMVLSVLGRPVRLLTDVMAHTQSRVTRYTRPTWFVKLPQYIWKREGINSQCLLSDLTVNLIWFYYAIKRLKKHKKTAILGRLYVKGYKALHYCNCHFTHFSLLNKCSIIMQKKTKDTTFNPQET